MKKPEIFDEIVHVDILGKGKYKIISFDRNLAIAAPDLAEALNDLIEIIAVPLRYEEQYNKAFAALLKAGYIYEKPI